MKGFTIHFLLCWVKPLLFIALLAASLVAHAQDEDSNGDDTSAQPPSVLNNVGSLADNAQRVTTDRFNRFVISIDDFFGGAESSAGENSSWGRLRVDVIDPDDDGLELKARLKLRVVLPNSEDRLRLLFSNEDDDTKDNQRGLETDTNAQDVAFALRFVNLLSEKVRLKFDIGAKVRDGKGQLFGRIKASNVTQLRWGIEQRISNNFFYFSSSGFKNRLRYDIRRTFQSDESVFLRSSTSIESQKGSSGVVINETIGLYADISSQTAVAFEGLFNAVSSRDPEFDAHYLGSEFRIRFRQNIWRPWFFYEIWPSVSFPVSSDFERELGGRVRIEMLFGQY